MGKDTLAITTGHKKSQERYAEGLLDGSPKTLDFIVLQSAVIRLRISALRPKEKDGIELLVQYVPGMKAIVCTHMDIYRVTFQLPSKNGFGRTTVVTHCRISDIKKSTSK